MSGPEQVESLNGGAVQAATGVRTVLGVRACDCGIQGPENLILALGERLAPRGVRYVVANLWDGEPPQVALHEACERRGLESHILRTSSGMSPAIIPMLIRLIRQIGPDVIHTHDVKAEFAGLVAARWTRVPLIGSFYGRLAIHSRFLKLLDTMRFPGFRLFDRVLPNSEAQRSELQRWRIPQRRVELVPSFVDTTKLRPPSRDERSAARRRLGIDDDRPVLSTVAKLSPNKGHTYMIRALPAIRTVAPDVLYLIPGEGDAEWRGEGGLRGALEREAAQLGVADHVRFLGYYDDLPGLLHATDLLCSPSLREGMQVALLEAMAVGLPIVATAIGGTPDAVVDGECGLLVPPEDPAALAAAVNALLTDPARMQAMGLAARARAARRFDAEVVTQQVLTICEGVAKRR